jgi:hypothetical protein
MNVISEIKLCELINGALELEIGKVDVGSSSENIDAWDSLGHLSILATLDRYLDGKAASLTELASATSVKNILIVLKHNSLYV